MQSEVPTLPQSLPIKNVVFVCALEPPKASSPVCTSTSSLNAMA
jgi:hypothetical protein